MLELSPQHVKALFLRGEANLRCGSYAESVADLSAALLHVGAQDKERKSIQKMLALAKQTYLTHVQEQRELYAHAFEYEESVAVRPSPDAGEAGGIAVDEHDEGEATQATGRESTTDLGSSGPEAELSSL